MSRGIRDLREIICISRLNNVNHVNEYDNFVDGIVNISCASNLTKNYNCVDKPAQNVNDTFIFQNNLVKTALPNIKSSGNDNLEDIVQHLAILDEKLISTWLCRANGQLADLSSWCEDENVFVNFCNFWLDDMLENQRFDLITMEVGILSDEIHIGLLKYVSNVPLTDKITKRLLNIAFWEHSSVLLSPAVSHMFLDYLDALTSTRCDKYKSILTDIKLVGNNSLLIQYVLAVRAFALVSLWSSICRFYRNLVSRGDVSIRPIELHWSRNDVFHTRVCIAVAHQFIPLIQYWIDRNKIELNGFRDQQGRTLLILAISYGSISLVQYLVTHFDMSSIVNEVSSTGNSALHMAVCQGDLNMVKLLVLDAQADVNISNGECDDCKPIHMAAIYGQEEIARFLVDNGAVPDSCTVTNNTPVDMACIHQQVKLASLEDEFASADVITPDGDTNGA